ncbi:unnamed protein product, partial [Tuber aestivum]
IIPIKQSNPTCESDIQLTITRSRTPRRNRRSNTAVSQVSQVSQSSRLRHMHQAFERRKEKKKKKLPTRQGSGKGSKNVSNCSYSYDMIISAVRPTHSQPTLSSPQHYRPVRYSTRKPSKPHSFVH